VRLRLGLRCEGVPHIQRREDMLLHIRPVGLSGHSLHDQAERRIVGVHILEGGAQRAVDLDAVQGAYLSFQCARARVGAGKQRDIGRFRQAR